jgi:hypothetical protein
MRIIRICLALILLPLSCYAQTAITATITDSDSTAWANGTWTASLVSPSGPPQGCTTPTTVAGIMNGGGTLTGSLCDNSLVGPSGSSWRFTLCPNASATCSQVQIAVTGATENLSTVLSNGVTAPRFAASFGAYGYADVEVTPKPPPGATYYNVTTPAFRQWSGTAWANIGGGDSSGFPINLGSTSIAASSTTTSVAGFTVNGVLLNSSGSTSLFLNQAGGYTTPPGGGCTAAGAIGTLQSSDGGGGCDATSLIFAGSVLTNTGTTGGVGYTASVTGASGVGEYSFSVDGSNIFELLNWGTGNGGGLSGVAGFFDSTNSLMVWNTNSTDDLFFGTPLSGGNVAAGTGSVGSILHTGAAKFTALTDSALTSGNCVQASTGGLLTTTGLPCITSFTTTGTSGAATFSGGVLNIPNYATGGSGISGLTAGFLPLAGSATTLTGNSHLDDGITNSGEVTSSEPVVIAGSTHGLTIPAGTAVSGLANNVIYASDATSGFAEVNENNTGLSRVCTVGNAQCTFTQTFPTAGIMVSTGSAFGTSLTAPTGAITGTIASGQTAIPVTALAANTCDASATTATATGAATTDAPTVAYASDPTGVTGYGGGTSGGISIRSWTTSNTFNFKRCNESGASITPGALNINWKVTR